MVNSSSLSTNVILVIGTNSGHHLSSIKLLSANVQINLTLANKICNLYACSHEYLLGISDDYDVNKVIVVENNSNMDLNAIAKVNEVIMYLNLLSELDDGVYNG